MENAKIQNFKWDFFGWFSNTVWALECQEKIGWVRWCELSITYGFVYVWPNYWKYCKFCHILHIHNRVVHHPCFSCLHFCQIIQYCGLYYWFWQRFWSLLSCCCYYCCWLSQQMIYWHSQHRRMYKWRCGWYFRAKWSKTIFTLRLNFAHLPHTSITLHHEMLWTVSTVFENHRKSLILHCERSELRLQFEWTKVHWKCQK